MTRQELRNLVIQNTRRSDKVSEINTALDLAVTELTSQRVWEDLRTQADLTCTADVGYVDLPEDYARGIEARVIDEDSPTSAYELIIRPKTKVVEYTPYAEGETLRKPEEGYIEDRKLFLVPIPDAEYIIRLTYAKIHPAFSGELDELLIRYANSAIVAWATSWIFSSLEKHEDAKHWFERYQVHLASAIKSDENSIIRRQGTPRGENRPVPPDYWNDPFVRYNP